MILTLVCPGKDEKFRTKTSEQGKWISLTACIYQERQHQLFRVHVCNHLILTKIENLTV